MSWDLSAVKGGARPTLWLETVKAKWNKSLPH